MSNRTLSCDVSFSQKAKVVSRHIGNETFFATGRTNVESGRERLKPNCVRVKKTQHVEKGHYPRANFTQKS